MGGGVNPEPEPETDYVDLGLPSGTLWATCNIGANSPEEAGLYFAWGETQGYTSGQVGTDKYFAWEGDHADYKYGPWSALIKYNETDGLTVLEPEDDAATANWGEEWRMPTKAEFEELITGTTTAWTEVNGVYGLLCTSTANTGNTLFFPAVGYAADGNVRNVGGYGYYWSASLNCDGVIGAWALYFYGGYCGVLNSGRSSGFSVRPVRL